MQKYLIKNIQLVNEGRVQTADVLLAAERIERIAPQINTPIGAKEISGEGLYLLPGVIDDQVHFREPGLTHKGSLYTESCAAVAGGVTSFMEMPNTLPPVNTQAGLEEKYALAAHTSLANYSFYMGCSNDNADEVLKTNNKRKEVCGIKIFMGSSTGNLLVDNYLTLDTLFRESEVLIATHCEEESVIQQNREKLKSEKGALSPADHPKVRNEEACFESSFKAVQLAKKHGSRLHILHISTEDELRFFTNLFPLSQKRITAEVCVHHLHFTAADYPVFGNAIKCNPAIKDGHHKEALWAALLDDRLDVIATDHAPHLWAEKEAPTGYKWPSDKGKIAQGWGEGAHSGLPLIQHSLLLMLQYSKEGKLPLEKLVQKMCHAPADLFNIAHRGYIREGYYADLVIADLEGSTTVSKENLLYKCGWSPFEKHTFPAAITHTFVNGKLVYEKGILHEAVKGKRLLFDR